jgi:hypothetical protein
MGGRRADLQEQRQRSFNLRLTIRGRQVENAQVVLVGPLGMAATQAVVGLAKQQRGEQIVAVAVEGKGTRLADQRVNQMAVVTALLLVATQAR